MAARREYRPHFPERLGYLPRSFARTSPGSIWLHAVSAGELISAIPLVRELRSSHPELPLYISTSTVAGRQSAERQAAGLARGIFYAPLDYASAVRRVLRTIRPSLLIVIETEIWPNLYSEVKRSGGALAVVNGRISDRAWPRYQNAKWLLAPILQLPDLLLLQSAKDCERYAALGASENRLLTAGNLKYDTPLGTSPLDLPPFKASEVWIAASTVGPNERGSAEPHAIDEDDVVIEVFKELSAEFPRLLTILAPRQPARFEMVAAKLRKAGIRFVRRTELQRDPARLLQLPGILLLDTIGELARTYSLANAVFVGGSIAPRGGHNIIEPAAAGKPVIVGPHMQNFEAIVADFLQARALIQISRPEELAGAVRKLLQDCDSARELGARARAVVESHRGVSAQIAGRLWDLYRSASPVSPRGLLSQAILGGLSSVWRQGGAIKRRRAERRALSRTPLPVPVISIGGITMGGSGKTPLTKHVAASLHERGFPVAILTRGYRRRSLAKHLVLAPGTKIPAAFTGDEPQIFLRSGICPIGIGADRYATAQIVLRQFPSTRVLLLDDGFQHAGISRNLDIVAIDGLDPFGQNAVFPLGRLREPLESLERADMFVVMRAPGDLQFDSIRKMLAEYNRSAPVFRARLRARCWRDYLTGAEMAELPARKVAAFCGLGNPENFWHTLEAAGLHVVFRWAFSDHHVYKPFELQRIAHQARAHGAEFLVTTEKDRINCPAHLGRIIAPLDLAWLEIDVEFEDESGFLSTVERSLERAMVGWRDLRRSHSPP
jgi:3-deoxy-D-manno-octulosonic-acid transferase